MYSPLDEQSFAAAFRAGDSKRFGLDLKKDRKDIIVAASKLSNTGFAKYGPVYSGVSNGRLCHSIKDYSQTLILRVLAKFLARRFRVEITNRDRMVRGVIESLSDSTPIYVLRRDISSFYESIPVQELKRRLTHGIFIPTILRKHLDCFFDTFCPIGSSGVPRGLCLSPILAELAMEAFDKEVRRLPGVYKYFRYSDDILVLSYMPTTDIEARLPALLPAGMQFNPKKSSNTELSCESKAKQAATSIEYLGYTYKLSDLCGGKNPREVDVCISERKISKLKTRIFRCFKAHQKDNNFFLLRDRLQFLSGNYVVQRHGATAIKSSKFVKSGIFYNYRLCGKYGKGETKPYEGRELKSLDGVYQSLIKPSTSIGSKLTASQYLQLRSISFYKGFELKVTTRFSPDRVAEMKKAWRNG